MDKIRVEWTENVKCAHEWTLAEAIELANSQLEHGSQLLADASADDIAGVLSDLGLEDALAEVDVEERLEYEVERTVDTVEVV